MLTEMSAKELASYERELRLRGPPGTNLKCATGVLATSAAALNPSGCAPPWCSRLGTQPGCVRVSKMRCLPFGLRSPTGVCPRVCRLQGW